MQVFQRPLSAPPELLPPPNPHGFIPSTEPSACDALLAISALINAAGPAVAPFAAEVADLLLLQLQQQQDPAAAAAAAAAGAAAGGAAAAATEGMEHESENTDELQAARICIELVGDLSRALGPEFGAVADPLLHQFYQLLKVSFCLFKYIYIWIYILYMYNVFLDFKRNHLI